MEFMEFRVVRVVRDHGTAGLRDCETTGLRDPPLRPLKNSVVLSRSQSFSVVLSRSQSFSVVLNDFSSSRKKKQLDPLEPSCEFLQMRSIRM